MTIYIVTENVKLTSGDRQYKKGNIFAESDVSPENLESWLRKGYVRKLDAKQEDETPKVSGGLPFYLTVDYYLTPDEVNKLKQADLVRYGQHINVPDFNPKATVTKLKKQINDFIESIDDTDDDQYGEQEDEQNNESGNKEGGVANVEG